MRDLSSESSASLSFSTLLFKKKNRANTFTNNKGLHMNNNTAPK